MLDNQDAFNSKLRTASLAALTLGAAGCAAAAMGFLSGRTGFAQSYLTAFLFWIGTALGVLPLIMLHHLTDGNWGYPIRRLMEVIAGTLPFFVLAFLPVAACMPQLYLWARPEAVAADALLQQKQLYLNVPGFFWRAGFYFLVWGALAYGLLRGSRAYEKDHSPKVQDKLQVISGLGLVAYGLTVTFAAVDWAMSLEPHWYSTIYGFIFLIGQTLSGFAFVILLARCLSDKGPLTPAINSLRVHDLGKLMFAFIMLWAYIAISQFVITWSGNLKEEIPWYLRRFHGGWQTLGLALPLFHFAAPFILLLSRDLKRSFHTLAPIAGWILFMRFVDVYWLVKPAFSETFSFSWMDLACMAGLGGLWIAWVLHGVRSTSLLLNHDPLLAAAETGEPHAAGH